MRGLLGKCSPDPRPPPRQGAHERGVGAGRADGVRGDGDGADRVPQRKGDTPNGKQEPDGDAAKGQPAKGHAAQDDQP